MNITDLQTLLTQSNRKNNDLQEKVRQAERDLNKAKDENETLS